MPETDTSWLQSKYPSFADQCSSFIEGTSETRGVETVIVKPNHIREVIYFLKDKAQFNVLMDLFVIDYLKFKPETPERFAMLYNLYSMETHQRIFVKTWVNENKCEIDSIHDIYKAVNWFEREAWDLYGVVFRGHPNLHRILCHTEFEGHALRKDYPSDGYQRLKAAVDSQGI